MRAPTYTEYLIGQGKSAKTTRDYGRELALALAWFDTRGLDFGDVQPSDLIAYAATRPNTPGVRAHLRTALTHYWAWQEVEGWPRAIRVPSPGPMVCKALTEPEARAICAAARGWWRPGTAVLVGTYLGLRNAEIAGMRWEGFDAGYEWYTLVGKNNRQRTVAVHDRLASELRGRADGSPFVFEGQHGGPVTHATIWNWVRRVAAEAGITSAVWPHRLRHTFGATANDATGDLRAVQAAMGHARVETTSGYTRATSSALRGVADAVADALR
jgi:integrase